MCKGPSPTARNAAAIGPAAASNPEIKKKDVVWFALNEDQPPFALAGIWTTLNGDRGTKSKPIPGPHQVHGPYDRGECGGEADPLEGDAGHLDYKERASRTNVRNGRHIADDG